MKYKVGDRVKVREDLVTGVDYNGLYCSKGMNRFYGKESVIEEIYSDCYYLELTTEYGFTDDMLEPVEETFIVRCINNKGYERDLTTGKIYSVIREIDGNLYEILDNVGMKYEYYKTRFELVEEIFGKWQILE